MTEAPERIWAKLVPDQFGPSGFGLIVDHAAFDGAVEFVPRAELEAAVLARIAELEAGLRKIADAPAWGAPDRWESTPFEVRQLARVLLNGADE